MLTKKQIEEIREHLDRAQNPVFFFDNDCDGLCSFLIFQRYLERGKGVPIKSFPELDKSYLRKVEEFNSDYIFILDKPLVSRDFFEAVEKLNIPVVWIDHHLVDMSFIPSFVSYYNPLMNIEQENVPTTELVYKITGRKEDMWIAVAGCLSDKFVPDYYNIFRKEYPELTLDSNDAHEIYYKSPIGKIARMLNDGLKDKTTNVMAMIRFLINAKTPYDVLEETTKNKTLHKRSSEIESKYQKILKKALELECESNIIFFQYGGDLSISGSLANELSFLFPDKLIIVCYIKGSRANISMRGKKSREIFSKAIEDIENATGGGHEEAVGGQIDVNNLENFKKNIIKIITEK